MNSTADLLARSCAPLRAGGEFCFSDVYCDRRLPAAVAKDPVLYGECLAGALYLQGELPSRR